LNEAKLGRNPETAPLKTANFSLNAELMNSTREPNVMDLGCVI
jgi:hypothetical protein